MKRAYLNFGVDTAAALLFLGMLATGFILRFPLPPGSQRTHVLWGLSRHEWGTVHTWLSFALIAVLLLHVGLHWPWIAGMVRRRFGHKTAGGPDGKSGVRSGVLTFLILAAIIALFAWGTFAGIRTAEREPERQGEQQRLQRGGSR